MHPPTHSTTPTCSHSRTNFLTTPPARPDTPPGRALTLHSQQFTQSAQPPPRPRPSRSTWLPGRRGIGQSSGRPHPSALYPAPDSAPQLRRPPATRVGRGLWKKENSRVCPGAGKSLVPTPFPRHLALADSSGRGAGRACALGFVLRTRPGGGGEGAGLPPPHRPPHQPCAQTPCWPPPTPETARFPRGRLGSRSACPRVPARRKLSSGRRPHAPRFLGPPGSDRCLRDRLSFVPKERGTRAGSPAP